MATPRAAVVHRQKADVDAELQAAVAEDGVLSLAGGVPADDLFPGATMARAMARATAEDGPRLLQYGYPVGLDRLREWLVAWLARRGVEVAEDQVLVTSGAQQGLCILASLLLPEGAPVAVESPTYVCALQAFDLRKPHLLPIARTAAGIDLEATRAALRSAGVLYVVPTGHNPTGGVLDRTQRAELLEIAARAGAWVIDDDAYGEIQFEAPVPPLRSFGAHLDRVIHLGSFSKVLAPGLRVGWIAGPPDLIRQATLVKQAQDLETATLTQRVLSHWLADNCLDDHIERCLVAYRSRRDALVGALFASCADLGDWDVPSGGFSLLFRPREAIDAAALLPTAIRCGVAWEPAGPYHPRGGGEATMRLSYANLREREIAEAVRRMARTIRAGVGG
jgi:DNA-binding transcriptional MocR family regulator